MSGPIVMMLSTFNSTEAEAVALWVETSSLSWRGGAVHSQRLAAPGDLV